MSILASSISQQDPLFLDADSHDEFIELSCLLGDVFPSDATNCMDQIPPTRVGLQQNQYLPEFAVVSPTVSSADVCSMVAISLPSLHLSSSPQQTKEYSSSAIRVSPTPSTNLFPVTNSMAMPPVPRVAPERVFSNSSVKSSSSSGVVAKKRRHSEVSSTSSDEKPDPSSRQKVRRRERNREHAKKSRSKKKDFTKDLEESAAILREENATLKKLIYSKLNMTKEDTDEMVKERIVTPADRFITALKRPSNRVLSNSAISYLNSLSKDCHL